jgi:hypothetical protein
MSVARIWLGPNQTNVQFLTSCKCQVYIVEVAL